MNQCGIKIVLDGMKSCFQDTKTGKVTKINVENGQYTFNIWVKADGKEKGVKEAVNETIAEKVSKEAWKKGNRFAALQKDDEVDNTADDMATDFIRREVRAR